MGSCAESTKPLHSTGLSPVNLLAAAGSDRLCRFLSQKCAVGGVNSATFFSFPDWVSPLTSGFGACLPA